MERKTAILEVSRSAFSLITEAQQAMAKAFDVPRVGVLRTVALSGPLRPSAVSEQLDMAPSSVTRHIQALEDAGDLTVRVDPTDARTCLIEVTKAGRTELARLEELGQAVFEEVVADWSVRDLQMLARLMRRLTTDWAQRGPSARRRHAHSDGQPRWRFRPPQQPEGEQP
jgi:DNA-binding MarR family transcriptional regulator